MTCKKACMEQLIICAERNNAWTGEPKQLVDLSSMVWNTYEIWPARVLQ